MAAIKKKEFSYIEKYSTKTKYKEDSFYYCGEAFATACGLPGPAMGTVNMFLGHSNTAKTNALILTAADVIKKGHLPVFIITEKKWNWGHAVQLGLQASQEADGTWTGDFIYNDGFKYIEQATDFMNELLNEQEKGNIPQSLCFLWDSIGSIPCKMTFEGKGGKQHNASVLADKIQLGLAGRISDSKKESYPYINTLVVVNQPWVELPDNPYGQPTIKAKGGNALWLAASLIFLFGNQKNSGVSNMPPVSKNGRKIVYATRTKISILKNHINGLAFQDGRIVATPHGFLPDTKEALDEYKKKYSQYWSSLMGGSGDVEFTESDGEEEILDSDDDE